SRFLMSSSASGPAKRTRAARGWASTSQKGSSMRTEEISGWRARSGAEAHSSSRFPALRGHELVRPRLNDLFGIGLLTLLYVATGKLGLSLGAVGGFATLVWAPTGVSLAALLVCGLRLWPGVALGAFLVNLWVGAPPAAALGIAVGNTLEALLAAY